MESGAKGCEVVVSGKLRAARAKSMKFTDGFMIHSGQPAIDFVDHAVRHVMLRQGVLGIKVKMCVTRVQLSKRCSYCRPQHERLGSRGPDWPAETSPRLRANCRPTSGQDRVRAVLRAKGASRSSPASSRGGNLSTTAARGLPAGRDVRRVCRSILILPLVCTLPTLYLAYTQNHWVCRLPDHSPPPVTPLTATRAVRSHRRRLPGE